MNVLRNLFKKGPDKSQSGPEDAKPQISTEIAKTELIFIRGGQVERVQAFETEASQCSVCGHEAHTIAETVTVGAGGARVVNADIGVKGPQPYIPALLAGRCLSCQKDIHLKCARPVRMPGATMFMCPQCGQPLHPNLKIIRETPSADSAASQPAAQAAEAEAPASQESGAGESPIAIGAASAVALYPAGYQDKLTRQVQFLKECAAEGLIPDVDVVSLMATGGSNPDTRVLLITGARDAYDTYLKMFYLPAAEAIFKRLFDSEDWSIIDPVKSLINVPTQGWSIPNLEPFNNKIREIESGEYQVVEYIHHKSSGGTSATGQPPAEAAPRQDAAETNQPTEGMSLEQVIRLIGEPRDEGVSGADLLGFGAADSRSGDAFLYFDKAPGFDYSIRFQQGKATSIKQYPKRG